MKKTALKKGLTFEVVKKVYIKDNCYNMPSVGTLHPGTVVEVVGNPTHISDVALRVLSGGGEIVQRNLHEPDQEREIKEGHRGFFFSQGHETCSPYDFGTLCSTYYKLIEEEKQMTKNNEDSRRRLAHQVIEAWEMGDLIDYAQSRLIKEYETDDSIFESDWEALNGEKEEEK